MIRKKTRKPKVEALLQIILLIVGVFAISYAIGSSIEVVSAADQCKVGEYKCVGDSKSRCTSEGKWNTYYDCRDKGSSWVCSGDGICVDLSSKDGNGFDFVGQTKNQASNFLTDYLIGLATKKSSTPDIVGDKPGFLGKDEAEKKYNTLVELEGGTNQDSEKGEKGEKGEEKSSGLLGAALAELAKTIYDSFSKQGILQTALFAGVIYGGLKLVGWAVGSIPGGEDWSKAISSAAPSATIAYLVGTTIVSLGTKEGGLLAKVKIIAALAKIPGLGWYLAGAMIIYKLLTWKTEGVQVVTYECNAWKPPIGGDYCEECNKGIFPCTEYRCKSLGAACELINKGSIDQMCISSKDDGKYPIITAWDDALLSNDYKYAPAGVIAPPDKGVFVQYTKSDDKCVPAFTKLSFGVTLNEAAYCKASVQRKDNFSSMNIDLSGGLALYNHSFQFNNFPGINNLTLENGANFDLYVRCQDYYGHSNTANFVFKFCVDEGPDYTNPSIEAVSPLNGAPIANNRESVETTFYINEPAECRWSHLNQDYENMENSMSCATSVLEMNAYMLYPCTTTLTGLENNKKNKFYIRCRDHPEFVGTEEESQRNTNPTSCIFAEDPDKCEYTLIGTEPLILNWVTPNNTLIKGPTNSVKVTIEAETSAGYDDGISTCYFSETGNDGSYVQFYDTISFKHSQDLWVSEGEYDYYIKCVDLGGNVDTATINFDVETDTSAPIIARVYYEDGYLKIATDEKSECVYDNVACNYNFDEGISMLSVDDFEHYITWNSNVNFYIKCKENRENGIGPPPNECSLIVRPFDIYS